MDALKPDFRRNLMDKSDAVEAKLMPCPFCEGEARLADMTERALREGIQHVKCRTCFAYHTSVAAWNTRAHPAPEASAGGAFVNGPVWKEDNEAEDDGELWAAEIQMTGGYAVAATVYAGSKDQASCRQEMIRAALTHTPGFDAARDRAVEALEPLAALADWWERSSLGDDYVLGGCRAGDGSGREVRLTLGDARRARAALAAIQPQGEREDTA